MIRINLLPAELRAAERTPFAKMLLIIGGTVIVALSIIMLAFVHLIWLPSAVNLREQRDVTRDKVETRALDNDKLRSQINGFEHRRKTIKNIFAGRILWAKKLDQICDLFPEDVWLDRMELRAARTAAKGQDAEGPTLTLSCHVVGNDESRIADFLRTIKQNTSASEDFYDDFLYVERPGWKSEHFKDFKEQTAFAFKLILHMKPLEARASSKGSKASSSAKKPE